MPCGQAAEDPSLELEEPEDDPAAPEELLDEPFAELDPDDPEDPDDEPDDESPLVAGTDADDPLRESVR